MFQQLKHFFVPHAGNNYHPHALHTKRAVFYGGVFAAMKALLFVFALMLPAEVFLVPDILQEQANTIVELTNQVRAQKGLPKLTVARLLNNSADARAGDMASFSYFSHVGPSGHTLAYFLKRYGYKYRVAGENLAMGFSDAPSVVDAWIKSPAHYSNLIDTDYSQIGLGVVAGYYNNQPTVFVAQHFGDPVKPTLDTSSAFSTITAVVAGSTPTQNVEGEKIALATSTAEVATSTVAANTDVVYNPDTSAVYWTDQGSATQLDVRASITGPVVSAIASVHNYPVELHQISDGKYAGTLTVNERSDDFFNPIITPDITIYGPHNQIIQDSIDWHDVKIVGKTPVQKYLQAKLYLRPITNLFSVSNIIYWGFLALFTIALIINIVVEVRRQHYHIIAQTLLIMAFLGWLLWV